MKMRPIRSNRHGVTNIEYAMIAAVIGISLLVAAREMGDGMQKISSLVAADIAPTSESQE